MYCQGSNLTKSLSWWLKSTISYILQYAPSHESFGLEVCMQYEPSSYIVQNIPLEFEGYLDLNASPFVKLTLIPYQKTNLTKSIR